MLKKIIAFSVVPVTCHVTMTLLVNSLHDVLLFCHISLKNSDDFCLFLIINETDIDVITTHLD